MPDVDPDEIDAPPACFRYPHCEAREACGWPACSEPSSPQAVVSGLAGYDAPHTPRPGVQR